MDVVCGENPRTLSAFQAFKSALSLSASTLPVATESQPIRYLPILILILILSIEEGGKATKLVAAELDQFPRLPCSPPAATRSTPSSASFNLCGIYYCPVNGDISKKIFFTDERMLKKSSGDGILSNHADRKKKQKIIQWDEVTIAEHDKERGSRYALFLDCLVLLLKLFRRQKIDEAPTPFRFGSESENSEAEYSSDGEHLARCKTWYDFCLLNFVFANPPTERSPIPGRLFTRNLPTRSIYRMPKSSSWIFRIQATPRRKATRPTPATRCR